MIKTKIEKLEDQLEKIIKCGIPEHFIGEKYHESSSPKGVVFKIACGLS